MLTNQTILTQPGPGIKHPVLYFQGKTQEVQLENQSAGDLNAKKQRSAGKIRDIKEITKSLTDGSSINPTGEQKFTTGRNCHDSNSVGEVEKSRDFCRGILSLNWETRAHCTSKNC